jgi:hypothetical protein
MPSKSFSIMEHLRARFPLRRKLPDGMELSVPEGAFLKPNVLVRLNWFLGEV